MDILLMVFISIAYLINSRLGALLLLGVAACFMIFSKGSLYDRVLKVIMYSVPYYPYSIFGDRQRLSLCIVAVLILCVFLTIEIIHRDWKISKATAYKMVLLFVFFIAYVLSVLLGSLASKEALFATYQLVILGYLICVLPEAKERELCDIDRDSLLKIFISGICATAIALYIQYGAYTIFDINLGQIFLYNSNRVIFNLYFSAKSVLSLYFAVGTLYFFIRYINENKLRYLIWVLVILGAMLINNSRTGLGSFAVCLVLYCLFHMKQLVGNIRFVVILILVAIAGAYVVQYMLETRGSLTGITDDNGRIEPMVEAFKMLPQYIFAGIGGSEVDYRTSSLGVAVHNFAVSYLVQFGVVGGLAIDVLLVSPVFTKKNQYWYYLVCVLLGGMFFAGWQNALYIIPVYILCILEGGKSDVDTMVRSV